MNSSAKRIIHYIGLTFSLLVLTTHTICSQGWYAKDNLFGGHDPSIVRYEDGYALMVTNNMLTLYTSEDAFNWKTLGKTLTSIPNWLKNVTNNQIEDIWAPDLYYFGNQFRVYYTGSAFGKNTSGIGYMSNSAPIQNGWTDMGEVVRSGSGNNYNAIDADVVKDANNNYWMTFGSWWDGIRLIRLDESTGKQANYDQTVYKIASRGGSGIEGPSIIEHNGQYFLFTAWDVCCKMGSELSQNTYKTTVGRADNITGPYVDRSGKSLTNGGGTILMERYGRYYGPGGGEAFKDLNRIRFVHHYYNSKSNGAPTLHVRDIVFTDDNWPEMGQPFLGRYLSVEAEHGKLTRGVSGDLVITESNTASNGEYVAYINTSGSSVRLPINIMQEGDYLLRYRYANGGTDATHNVSINGENRVVKLPPTGAWGTFPENSIVYIPVKLKRGGNFIEVRVGENFAELDRIDFLRIVRDSLPGNGFDNGMHIRLNENDELAMKDGGWALFENVITDSIQSKNWSIVVKNANGGKLSIRTGSKNGPVIASCELPYQEDDQWTEVNGGTFNELSGIQDLFLTVSGNAKEFSLRNLKFGESTSTGTEDKEVSHAESPYYDTFLQRFDIGKICDWTLYNVSGNIISTGNSQYIDMKNLSAGVYIIKSCDCVMKVLK